jgi:hypothetical protein
MPDPYPYPEHCYHEAGHAVVAVHHGLKLLYVTMEPPSDSGHFGQTATAPVVMELTQLEIAMQVAAAGEIASSWFLPNREAEREKRTNEYLIRRLRAAARAETESDPWYRNVDNLTFAKRGRERDAEIRGTGPDSDVGPEGWVTVFREAERLVCDELWAAVDAVAGELIRNPTGLSHEVVARLTADAAPNAKH